MSWAEELIQAMDKKEGKPTRHPSSDALLRDPIHPLQEQFLKRCSPRGRLCNTHLQCMTLNLVRRFFVLGHHYWRVIAIASLVLVRDPVSSTDRARYFLGAPETQTISWEVTLGSERKDYSPPINDTSTLCPLSRPLQQESPPSRCPSPLILLRGEHLEIKNVVCRERIVHLEGIPAVVQVGHYFARPREDCVEEAVDDI